MHRFGDRRCLSPFGGPRADGGTRFYESRAIGLGGDFVREMERALGHIIANPEAGSVLVGTVRRWLLRRFPFAILYQIGSDVVSVIALMHLHRRPGYWKRRVRDVSRTDR